jgi:YCII-related domain
VVVGAEPASVEAVRGAAKRGPKWVAGKPAGEQALRNHGRYLQEQMTKGALQLAGPFLDDSGGLILYNARDEAEVRAIVEHDPGGGGWDAGGGVDPAVSTGPRRREREEPVERGEVIGGDRECSVTLENPPWSGPEGTHFHARGCPLG